ncbi:unnamed protein product [Ectocarpus sp. 4 AP-2014]
MSLLLNLGRNGMLRRRAGPLLFTPGAKADPTAAAAAAAAIARGASSSRASAASASREAEGAPGTAAAVQSSVEDEVRRIRNIGIIAHIDAGKTTTTERILYLTGKITRQGSVDSGDTVTDFMPQERERGITIQSAAVTVEWGGGRINVIDTPGHVDFGLEVERCARVLDGAVLILDGVAGVQAQTETVWRTAQKHEIPAIAFVNKLDRQGADFKHVLGTLERRLGVLPLPLQARAPSTIIQEPTNAQELLCSSIPVGTGTDFVGMVDLVTMTAVLYQAGADGLEKMRASARDSVTFVTVPLDHANDIFPGTMKRANAARQELLWALADADEAFAELVLERDQRGGGCSDDANDDLYSLPEILSAVRRVCLSRAAVPVLCGSSLRGIGVEPLLDSVSTFLPSPLDRPRPTGVVREPTSRSGGGGGGKKRRRGEGAGVRAAPGAGATGTEEGGAVFEVDPLQDDLVAFVFKVTYDKQRGLLSFFRVYSGALEAKVSMYNATRGAEERPLQVLRVEADDLRMVDSVSSGDVAVAVGLPHAATGDTLVGLRGGLRGLQLDGVAVPPPVFSLAVEVESSSQQASFEAALAHMVREDPSLVVEVDEESGQTVLKGIGELHLEVACDRLRREFGVQVQTGQAYVAYREGILEETEIDEDYERTFGGKTIAAGLTIRVTPTDDLSSAPEVQVSPEVEAGLVKDEMDALLGGLNDALRRGPAGGYPMTGLTLRVLAARKFGDRATTPGAVRFAAASAVGRAAREAGGGLLEPMMEAEVSVPDAHVGAVLQDLTANRRAEVRSVDGPELVAAAAAAAAGRGDGGGGGRGVGVRHEVRVRVPLRELLGYATTLRSLSAGEASFTMELGGYARMDEDAQRTALDGGW